MTVYMEPVLFLGFRVIEDESNIFIFLETAYSFSDKSNRELLLLRDMLCYIRCTMREIEGKNISSFSETQFEYEYMSSRIHT